MHLGVPLRVALFVASPPPDQLRGPGFSLRSLTRFALPEHRIPPSTLRPAFQINDLCPMLARPVLIILLLSIGQFAWAQPADTLGVSSDTTSIRTSPATPIDTSVAAPIIPRDSLNWRQRHSPRRATLLSAIAPGAGQIYNRKYWKAPIVWGGLGVCIYFIQDNNKEYQRYRTAYLALVDNDPSTMDEFNGRYPAAEVRRVMETYQRWRDVSWLALAGVYILNIVDASVDAHFVRFDVSPDLSLNIGPSLYAATTGSVGLDLCFTLR